MIKIKNISTENLDQLIQLVDENSDILKPNNTMIYYLCCTFFKDSSFIAFEENNPVGFVLSFSDLNNQSLWIHQFAVIPGRHHKGIGTKLLKKLEDVVFVNGSSINEIKLAVRTNNNIAINFYKKHGFEHLVTEKRPKMEIFVKKNNFVDI